MPPDDKAIRIIKRDTRVTLDEKLELSVKTEKQIRREILNTITSWIEECRERNEELRRSSFCK